ncbi:hypothetical protein PPK15_gp87 [Bacillus phage 000TH010]|uniref:Uncharacterized protein n=1 Tax=Bacillus phage 000TH010 TaxID=2601652 RepID=A0A5P8PJQ4_9CAUD|nr:hypothetical protein PPK15_gp87 [Bacillus phage 000TH010]QFR56300.1 hypothetical protein 000TH010_87 [Bacillus phage 000TH010]
MKRAHGRNIKTITQNFIKVGESGYLTACEYETPKNSGDVKILEAEITIAAGEGYVDPFTFPSLEEAKKVANALSKHYKNSVVSVVKMRDMYDGE